MTWILEKQEKRESYHMNSKRFNRNGACFQDVEGPLRNGLFDCFFLINQYNHDALVGPPNISPRAPVHAAILMQEIFQRLVQLFVLYGYWTVFFGVMIENAGLPVPGETVLLVASFLAANSDTVNLKIEWIIIVAIFAATMGDNLGYWIGRRGGRPFLERHARRFFIRKQHIDQAERIFQRYGAWTVFFARFVTGLRVVAGPFSGVLHLPWARFSLFNFLGAVLWATAISLVGYFFGSEWPLLLKIIKRFNLAVLGLFILVMLVLYLRHRAARRRKTSVR